MTRRVGEKVMVVFQYVLGAIGARAVLIRRRAGTDRDLRCHERTYFCPPAWAHSVGQTMLRGGPSAGACAMFSGHGVDMAQ